MQLPNRLRMIHLISITAFAICLALSLLSHAAAADAYQVQKGDTLTVTIFQWPEYSGDSKVNNDGTISLPAFGRIEVHRQTLDAIEKKITDRLKVVTNLPNPRVVVKVSEYRPISVLGAVNRPGRYAYDNGLTVLDAVALAGGFLSFGAGMDNERQFLEITKGRARLEILMENYWFQIARKARLLAEQNGLDKIEFPAEFAAFDAANEAVNFAELERAIFTTRRSSMTRQLEILDQQSKIIRKKIAALNKHSSAIKRSVDIMGKEYKSQTALLQKGLTRRPNMINAFGDYANMQGEFRRSLITGIDLEKELKNVEKSKLLIEKDRQTEVNESLLETELRISTIWKEIEQEKVLNARYASLLTSSETAGGAASSYLRKFKFDILRNGPNGEVQRISNADRAAPILGGDVLTVLLVN